jgi:hypothetical protein
MSASEQGNVSITYYDDERRMRVGVDGDGEEVTMRCYFAKPDGKVYPRFHRGSRYRNLEVLTESPLEAQYQYDKPFRRDGMARGIDESNLITAWITHLKTPAVRARLDYHHHTKRMWVAFTIEPSGGQGTESVWINFIGGDFQPF